MKYGARGGRQWGRLRGRGGGGGGGGGGTEVIGTKHGHIGKHLCHHACIIRCTCMGR